MPRKPKNYYTTLDKRSSEYKKWKKFKDRQKELSDEKLGLGDYAEKIFKYTGVKAVVEFLAGEDCGCDERKERLNNVSKWFRDTNVKCLTQDEYTWLDEYFKDKKGHVVHSKTQYMLVKIFNRVFSQRRVMSTCSPCVKELVDKLELLYNNYTDETEETDTSTGDK